MFGIPNEVIASAVTLILMILARRLGIKLPLDTPPVSPDAPVPTPPTDPAKKDELESVVEKVVLSLVNKLFKREELPPGPRAQVELLIQELSKK